MRQEVQDYIDANFDKLDHMVRVEAGKLRPTIDPIYEDLCQEGWLGIAAGAEKVDLTLYPFTYFQKFARGYMMRAAQKDAKRRKFEALLADPTELTGLDLCEMQDVSNNASLAECIDSHLDDREKKILRLRMEGYTLAEIGEVWGHTKAWAKVQLDHIANRLSFMGGE